MIGLLALFLTSATAYNNGMGKVPALGWSSWYASPFGSEVTESFVKANAQAIKAAGLLQAGFSFINVDEGWLKGRYAENGTIFEDFEKFPSGMRGLGDWLKAEGFSYGLYSCRGTCQCGTGKYSGPGSHGFEREDVDWMVEAGSTWLKIDSCCGSQDHGTAFSDYAKFRDAMNATGVPVYFNLCGWAPWYSPPDPALNYSGGISLGNSWRIWGDGGSWGMIVGAINTMAQLADYNQPFGFNDPDNILGPHGTVGTVSESQARAQMVLWSLFPTQLIIGEDMTQASAEYIATVGNSELIAINQDWPFVGPARRIVGSDLKFPCNPPPLDALYAVQALPCEASPAPSLQDWLVDTAQSTVELLGGSGGYLTLGPAGCASSGNDGSAVFVSSQGSGAACAAQQWVHQPSNGSFVGPFGKCLDEYMWTTKTVDLWACLPGAKNLYWNRANSTRLVNEDSGNCLTAVPVEQPTECFNVWARPLSSGATALGLVSNVPTPQNITCDAQCFASANITAKRVHIRDLIQHRDLGEFSSPLSVSVLLGGGGDGGALLVTPLQ